jgi:TonB family protein
MLESPFPKGTIAFRSAGGAGPATPHRIRFLRRTYTLHLAVATVLSVLLHGALGYGLRGVTLWPEARKPIGLPGPTRLLDIEPYDSPIDRQRELAETRVRTGALLALDYEPEEVPPPPRPQAFEPPPPPPTPPTPDAKVEGPTEPIRIELREDFTIDPASPEAALSDQFNPIRLVLPEYPERAFERNIQGVVKLEAKVGISGKVLDVRVLAAEDPDLSLAASRAMLLWEFRPYVVQGKPQPFRIVVPFRFRIEG